jgi:hypothetical protein
MTGKQPNKMQVPAASHVACGRCKGLGQLEGRGGLKLTCYECRGTGKKVPGYSTK